MRNLAWLKYSINPSLNQKIIAYRINPNVELENEMFSSPVYQTTNQLDLSEVGYLIAAIAHTADVFEAVQKHVSGQNLSGIEIERVNEALRALPIEANALPKKLQENPHIRPVLWGAVLFILVLEIAAGILTIYPFLFLLGLVCVSAYIDLDMRHTGFPTIFMGVAKKIAPFDASTSTFYDNAIAGHNVDQHYGAPSR